MTIVGQKIANAPLGSFPVLSDTVGDSRAQIIKLDFGAVGASDMVTLVNPLPVQVIGGGGGGDATAANQVLQTALLTTIDADTGALVLKDFSTETTLSAINAKVTACNTGAVVISSGTVTTTKTALTPSSPTAVSVGASSASAVAANASRKGLVLTNTSNNRISLGLGAAAVLNSGITLTAFSVWVMDDYTFCTSEIFAIADVASSNLAIQEFV
jgi:hypothetical protein